MVKYIKILGKHFKLVTMGQSWENGKITVINFYKGQAAEKGFLKAEYPIPCPLQTYVMWITRKDFSLQCCKYNLFSSPRIKNMNKNK